MIFGIGIDIIELNRIRDIYNRQPKFINRILTINEKQRLAKLSEHRQVEFIAGRFAAKEAFSKALGTGFGKELSFLDLEISSNEQGKPIIKTKKIKNKTIHLSISHSKEYAVAQVIIEV